MYFLAFLLGLTGSLHCVGMCGPIALALPVHHRSGVGKVAGITLYNLGRITVYAAFGLLAGSVGFVAGNWQSSLSIGAGVVLVGIAVGSGKWWETLPSGSFFKSKISFIGNSIRRRLANRSFASLTIMGALNGMLPCGMVYLALVSALAMPDALSGTTYMALFGLGTFPTMMITAFMGQWASVKWRLGFKKVTPYLVAIAGIVLIVRGLSPASGHDHHHGKSKPIPVCIGE